MTNAPKVIDVFAGVGGFSLGAARAGFDLIGAVDNDTKACATHALNFPNTQHLTSDIQRLSGADLLAKLEVRAGDVDGLIGGPPCQGFSEMGRRDEADPRNNLLIDFFRLVAEIAPSFFVAENVPGILAERNRAWLKRALDKVPDSYAVVGPMIIEAQKFGAPTTRRRVFIIGYDPRKIGPIDGASLAAGTEADVRVEEALRGLPRLRSTWQSEAESWRTVAEMDKTWFGLRVAGHVPKGVGDPSALSLYRSKALVSGFLGTAHSADTIQRFATLRPGERDPVSKGIRLDPSGYCPTLRAGTGPERGSYQAVRPIHPSSPRVISPREAARLQGFPDWFVFHPTKWHAFRQLGNSVSPIVAEVLLSRIGKAMT